MSAVPILVEMAGTVRTWSTGLFASALSHGKENCVNQVRISSVAFCTQRGRQFTVSVVNKKAH